MRCGFRPHDRDRTTESMEGRLDGFWATLEGVLGCTQKRFYGSPVNRWSIKLTPNDTKFDRRSTDGVPRPLGKSQSIPRTFNTHSRKEARGVRRCT